MMLATSGSDGSGACCLCDWTCQGRNAVHLDGLICAHLTAIHGRKLFARRDDRPPARGEEFGRVTYNGQRFPDEEVNLDMPASRLPERRGGLWNSGTWR